MHNLLWPKHRLRKRISGDCSGFVVKALTKDNTILITIPESCKALTHGGLGSFYSDILSIVPQVREIYSLIFWGKQWTYYTTMGWEKIMCFSFVSDGSLYLTNFQHWETTKLEEKKVFKGNQYLSQTTIKKGNKLKWLSLALPISFQALTDSTHRA